MNRERLGKLVAGGAIFLNFTTGCVPQVIEVADLLKDQCKHGFNVAKITEEVLPGSKVTLWGNRFVSEGGGNYHLDKVDENGFRVSDGTIFYWDNKNKLFVAVNSQPGASLPDGSRTTSLSFSTSCTPGEQ